MEMGSGLLVQLSGSCEKGKGERGKGKKGKTTAIDERGSSLSFFLPFFPLSLLPFHIEETSLLLAGPLFDALGLVFMPIPPAHRALSG
jgi:hypothetical protein